ncbi:SLATT domain-containing protein [Saccharomonospora sp. NPDC046836]|uniref:SLATT domain-containing protein n=2 Tax=Actinomycetes TaxID=1760 RepID=UPI0033DEF1C2
MAIRVVVAREGQSVSEVSGENSADALIAHRREVEAIRRRIAHRRLQVIGLWGTPVAFLLILLSWVVVKWTIWPHGDGVPWSANGTFIAFLVVTGIASLAQLIAEFEINSPWLDSGTSVGEIKLELQLAEERRVLAARGMTPPLLDRQATYRERMPGEISRLRKESRHYRRIHLFMQWLLFVCSASITAVTAWYDPPQPGKGVLIGLGFTVSAVTAASGYFKPKERSFNLQQTADSLERHATAIELGIPPYVGSGEDENLRSFAIAVEDIRAEQRLREQQLDQPQQGQGEVL